MIIINRIIGILIIITNIYFIPFSYITIKESGGLFNYEILTLLIILSPNLLLITAILSFMNKFKGSFILMIINGIGLSWNIFLLRILLTVPILD